MPVSGLLSQISSNGPSFTISLGEVLPGGVGGAVHPPVALPTEPQEVVVLGHDLARPGARS